MSYAIKQPSKTGEKPPLTVDQEVAQELVAACTAVRVFLDAPGRHAADEALAFVTAYGGPLSERIWPDMLRLLTGRQRTRLLTAALEMYIAGEPPIHPAD